MFSVNSFRDSRFGVRDHRSAAEREDAYAVQKKVRRLQKRKQALFNLDSADENEITLTHGGWLCCSI